MQWFKGEQLHVPLSPNSPFELLTSPSLASGHWHSPRRLNTASPCSSSCSPLARTASPCLPPAVSPLCVPPLTPSHWAAPRAARRHWPEQEQLARGHHLLTPGTSYLPSLEGCQQTWKDHSCSLYHLPIRLHSWSEDIGHTQTVGYMRLRLLCVDMGVTLHWFHF